MVSERFIERMTWPEVEAAIESGVDTVLIPIGTTEQHGHHMPLDTDCVIARSLCARTAERGGGRGPERARRADGERVALLVPHAVPGEHPAFDDDVLRGLPRDLRLARPPRLRAARRRQRARRQRRRADGRGQPLLRDDGAARLPRAVVGPRGRRARRGRGAADPRRGGGDVAGDGARPAGRDRPGDARRLGPRRGGARGGPAVDVARPLRDAPEGAGRDRADGHAPRHHGVGRRRRRDAREQGARRADGRGGRAPDRPGVQGPRRKGA